MKSFINCSLFLCVLLAVFEKSTSVCVPPAPLKSYGPLASNISSVSGFSSGGAKTLHYLFSHSSKLRGACIFSGLMYDCGEGKTSELTRLVRCAITVDYNESTVEAKIEENAEVGLFDPLEGLKRTKIYISHGTPDPIVNIEEGKRINKSLTEKSSPSQVYFNVTQGSHGFPTYGCGPSCGQIFPPTVSGCLSCGWSGAYECLNYIYNETLTQPDPNAFSNCSARTNFTNLFAFNQSEFFPEGISAERLNMNCEAYIYVPTKCQEDASQCTLHVHIHGCGQIASSPLVLTDYMKCSGMPVVAEANNIIVLFPQANFGVSAISTVLQCWDFVGYTGKDYGTKKGYQIQAFERMVNRVLSPRSR